ncbi:hypothetical protein NM688_g6227 [Phlebia brevispora]|uniref:Uncharacterized protein n=1 Tax=Phlebia brevispora TaxID=194682 RepID=A0ACC1SIG2_9APHY|nr:hypothetical protein NM688_g6227 [Phlebia brevispora]
MASFTTAELAAENDVSQTATTTFMIWDVFIHISMQCDRMWPWMPSLVTRTPPLSQSNGKEKDADAIDITSIEPPLQFSGSNESDPTDGHQLAFRKGRFVTSFYGPALQVVPTMVNIPAERDLNEAALAAVTFMSWDALVHISAVYMVRPPFMDEMGILDFADIAYMLCSASLTLSDQQLQPRLCRVWLIYQAVFVAVLILTTEIALAMRLYFLYNEYKIVQQTIVLTFIVEIVAMVVAICLAVPKISFSNPKCTIIGTPNVFVTYWLSSLLFEGFLFGLTVLASFKFRNSMRSLGRKSLVFLFVRDGTWAFAMIFGQCTALEHLVFALTPGFVFQSRS